MTGLVVWTQSKRQVHTRSDGDKNKQDRQACMRATKVHVSRLWQKSDPLSPIAFITNELLPLQPRNKRQANAERSC